MKGSGQDDVFNSILQPAQDLLPSAVAGPDPVGLFMSVSFDPAGHPIGVNRSFQDDSSDISTKKLIPSSSDKNPSSTSIGVLNE